LYSNHKQKICEAEVFALIWKLKEQIEDWKERLMSSLSKFFNELENGESSHKGGAENDATCCANVFRDLLCAMDAYAG
jgi:hypothetical protein